MLSSLMLAPEAFGQDDLILFFLKVILRFSTLHLCHLLSLLTTVDLSGLFFPGCHDHLIIGLTV